MNKRTCTISLAVILAGLAAVWIIRTRPPETTTGRTKHLHASTSQLPSSTSNGTVASEMAQPQEVIDTNSATGPIPTTRASVPVPSLEVLNDRTASLQSRAAAADALGFSRSSNAVASLIVIVGDQSENVVLRYKAARALGSIGDQTAAFVLSNLLLNSTVDNHLRLVSALALGNMGGPEAVHALTAAASDSDSILRFKAIQGLMRTRDKSAVAPVLTAMRDGDADVEAVATQAYGLLAGTNGVVNICDKMTRTDSAFIKIACLDALGEAGGAEAESILMEYTTNSNDLLRINAQRALQRAKGILTQ